MNTSNCSVALLNWVEEAKLTDLLLVFFTIMLAIATVQLARATNVLAKETRRSARQQEMKDAIDVYNEMMMIGYELRSQDQFLRLDDNTMHKLNKLEQLSLRTKEIVQITLLYEIGGRELAKTLATIQDKVVALRESWEMPSGEFCELDRVTDAIVSLNGFRQVYSTSDKR